MDFHSWMYCTASMESFVDYRVLCSNYVFSCFTNKEHRSSADENGMNLNAEAEIKQYYNYMVVLFVAAVQSKPRMTTTTTASRPSTTAMTTNPPTQGQGK
jgi:hypothetical protein